jgi:predicted short-subunit dehydrogenase-like oxidoreductase (DUF2520 family)
MRQVPQKNRNYLIVGNGKVARHLSTYFDLLNLPYHSWWRSSGENIYKKLLNSEKVLVAISDDAITKFASSLVKEFPQKTFIHFSGLLCVPGVESAHPLMTFSDKLYDLNTYLQIPFVIEKKQKPFKELFPELKNYSIAIESEFKPFYHAWCSIAGNFTTALWTAFFKRMHKIGINKELCFPYMTGTMDNLFNQTSPLTGPFSRNDLDIIKAHKKCLKNDPYHLVYKAMEKAMKAEGQI